MIATLSKIFRYAVSLSCLFKLISHFSSPSAFPMFTHVCVCVCVCIKSRTSYKSRSKLGHRVCRDIEINVTKLGLACLDPNSKWLQPVSRLITRSQSHFYKAQLTERADAPLHCQMSEDERADKDDAWAIASVWEKRVLESTFFFFHSLPTSCTD